MSGGVITLLAPLLAIGGFALYFLISFRFAVYRRHPWEFLALIAAGTALAVHRVWVAPGVGTGVAAAVSAGVLGFACWFLFSFSMYARREERPRVGERFPDFALPGSDGKTFHLAEHRGRHLIVLYRGAW